MTIQRKKVLILYCGSVEGVTDTNLPQWLQRMPELDIIADIDSVFIATEKENLSSPKFWQKVADSILKHQKKYNGFVIIHPVETLLYTASAQSFLLHNLKKPIVFTGTQKREDSKDNQLGIKANLINAVQVATLALPETAVIFGNSLIRANTAKRIFDYSLNTFEGPENAVLGKIDFSIRLFEKHLKKIQVLTQFKAKLNDNIEYIKIQPVFNINELKTRLKSKAGIFVEGHGQDIPSELRNLLAKSFGKIPVILHDVKNEINDANITTIDNMTLESSLVKFMYILAQTKNINEIKKMMLANIAGEII